MADFKPTVKKHAINDKKLQLWAPNASGKSASLKFNVVKNNPRIDVYTNDDSDPKSKEALRAAMDQPTFFLFLECLEKASKSKEVSEYIIVNKGYTFFGGKKGEKPEVLSKTIVGRDDTGKVYIMIAMRGRPSIKFYTLPGNWHNLVDTSGNAVDPGIVSSMLAMAWVNLLRTMVSVYLVFNYEEEAPRENNNGGGGQNRWQGGGGGNGGGGQSQAASSSGYGDEDPF